MVPGLIQHRGNKGNGPIRPVNQTVRVHPFDQSQQWLWSDKLGHACAYIWHARQNRAECHWECSYTCLAHVRGGRSLVESRNGPLPRCPLVIALVPLPFPKTNHRGMWYCHECLSTLTKTWSNIPALSLFHVRNQTQSVNGNVHCYGIFLQSHKLSHHHITFSN